MTRSKPFYNQRHLGVNENEVWFSTRVGLIITETGGLTRTSGIPSFWPGPSTPEVSHASGAQLSSN